MLQPILNGAGFLIKKSFEVGEWTLDGVVFAIKSTIWLFLSGILQSISALIWAINAPNLVFDFAARIAGLPPAMIYFFIGIGFPQLVGMIAAAFGVRFAMNLVPSYLGTGLDKL